MFYLGKGSRGRLAGVHQDLVIVMATAITYTDIDFGITEGMRSIERQRELVAAGASRTMKSRHLTGHAVDVVCYMGGRIAWDWPLYSRLAEVIKDAASDCKIRVEWGGDWKTFKDGPHWQLPWRTYR